MHTQIINAREVRIVPTPIGRIYHDLLEREARGDMIFETWERPDGSKYMIPRKKTHEELIREKETMLNDALSDWKKLWK